MLHEALPSPRFLFGTSHETFQKAGPAAGIKPGSVGGIAMVVLNNGLRPFPDKWHPALLDWDSEWPPKEGARVHEKA